MRSSKVVDDGETIGKKGFGVVCGKDTIGSFLLDRRKPRRTMNASERVSKVCALECNFLSPTLKVRDFQMEVKRTPLVDYIEKPQKDVTSLGSLVANVGFGITDEVSSVLKDMVLLASTHIRLYGRNRHLKTMARLASLGLQKTISELRSITTPVKKKRKRNGLKLAFVLDTEFAPATFGPYESVLKEGQLIVDQGHSHPSSSLLTYVKAWDINERSTDIGSILATPQQEDMDISSAAVYTALLCVGFNKEGHRWSGLYLICKDPSSSDDRRLD
ncbi:hypothetical protein Tco_0278213 [Tanacetum coccineum]